MKLSLKIKILIITSICISNIVYAQIGGRAGSFARMGFGSRGMGMGNAMSAVTIGDINTYYNPALIPFAEHRYASLTFSIMPFDRYLNFLSYGQSIKPTAGISAGIINAGVTNIDSRDNDGYHIENLSTPENQFYLAFGNKLHKNFSIGVAVKLYYHKLYEKVSSTTVGFDLGALLRINDDIAVGLAVQDISSKYKWDTAPIYGQSGGPTKDNFPNIRRLAVSYNLPNNLGIAAIEIENSSEKTNTLRMGTEIKLHEYFLIRTGIDRWNIENNYSGIKPTFGFSVNKPFDGWKPMISYAYVLEPFSTGGIHIITLTVSF